MAILLNYHIPKKHEETYPNLVLPKVRSEGGRKNLHFKEL